MSEENNTPPEPPAPDPTPAAPAEPVFTQADIDAAAAKARNQGKRQAKKELEAQMAQSQTQNAPPAPSNTDEPPEWAAALIQSNAELRAKVEATENASAFSAATAGVTMSESEQAIAQTLFEHNRPAFDAMVKEKLAVDQPPEAKGPGFNSPGAPAATPRAPDASAPSTWTRDDIASMQANGTFLSNLKKHRQSLGGGGAFFPAKDPKKGSGN